MSVKRLSKMHQLDMLLKRPHTHIFIHTCSQRFIAVLFTGIWIIFENVQNNWFNLFLLFVFLLLEHKKLCLCSRLIICLSITCSHDTFIVLFCAVCLCSANHGSGDNWNRTIRSWTLYLVELFTVAQQHTHFSRMGSNGCHFWHDILIWQHSVTLKG